MVVKSLINAGIEKHVRVHELRHTAASLAFLKGIPGKVVQEMLGHSHYSTTMDIYSHVDPDMHKEASKQMNEALQKGPTKGPTKARVGVRKSGAQEGTRTPTLLPRSGF